jgi:hypothetical protein
MTCNYSKAKIFVGIVISAFFMAGSLYALTQSSMTQKSLGGIGVIFFGLCLYQVISSFFKKGPGIVVDEKGIEDFQWGWGVIPWSDIIYVSIKTVKSTRFLNIETKDPNVYLAKVKGITCLWKYSNEIFGFPPICSNFNLLTPGVDEVFDYIKAKYPDKIKPAS